MAIKISSFTGLRPIKKLAHSIVSSSFDNLSVKEIKKASKNINWNFLNILSPETFFPSHSKKQLTNYVRGYLRVWWTIKYYLRTMNQIFIFIN